MAGKLRDYRVFFQALFTNYKTTGAVVPSSDSLARRITKYAVRHNSPARILEVGPGTGVFTRRLVESLRDGDRLVVVELSEEFVRLLAAKFEEDPCFAAARHQVEIVHGAIEYFEPKEPFDYIVCGLPFNNFAPDLVRHIFQRFRRLVRPEGVVSYFEYLWVRPMKMAVSSVRECRRLSVVGRTLQVMRRRYEFDRDLVLRNFPPAVVHHLRFQPAAVQAAGQQQPKPAPAAGRGSGSRRLGGERFGAKP
jgi:phospholipid N-methyltransferase